MSDCSVTRGPSAEQWRTHKDEITALYLCKGLCSVRKHMVQRYGFRASKRMFDARFKSWGVQKNLRRADKERMAQGMTRADTVSEKDRKKVMRYLFAEQRRSKSKSISSSPGEGKGQSLSEQSSSYSSGEHTPSSGGQSIVNESPHIETITLPQAARPCQSYRAYNSVRVEVAPPNHGMERLSLAITITEPTGTSSGTIAPRNCFPIARQLSPSAADRNVELLWTTMSHFISSRTHSTSPYALPHTVLNDGCTESSRSFWDKVENGIYQVKIGNAEGLAVPAFNDAKKLLQSMFCSGQVSLDLLRKLLYTLSPTNTAMCSERRTELMSLIRGYAAKGLGVDHPITKICAILLADEESSDLSRRALIKMYAMISIGLGQSHAASCKIMDSVITLARRTGEAELRKLPNPTAATRSRELATAMSLASQAHLLAIQDHGLNSDQSRQAAYTLADLCTVTHDFSRAHTLRLQIIQQRLGTAKSTACGDAISAYTMESIAEACSKGNDYQGSTIWLQRAEGIASSIWDPSMVSRIHISNKLQIAYARLGESMVPVW